jgi:hypothetical protein
VKSNPIDQLETYRRQREAAKHSSLYKLHCNGIRFRERREVEECLDFFVRPVGESRSELDDSCGEVSLAREKGIYKYVCTINPGRLYSRLTDELIISLHFTLLNYMVHLSEKSGRREGNENQSFFLK